MTSFVPYVPATGVRRNGEDVNLELPDLARHAGATLTWLPLAADGVSPFPLLAPITGTCRRIPVNPPLPGLPGVATILELSPLPFTSAPVLRRLPGYPTFYLAPVTTSPLPADNHLVRANSPIVHTSTVFVGMLFDDRVTLTPAAWVEQIALAMTSIDTPAEVTAWRGLNRFAPTGRALRVLDHAGRPLPGAQILVNTTTLTTDPSGTLPLPPGDLQLSWQATRPVHALYERALAAPGDRTTSTPPGTPLLVPAGLTSGHLQLFDAANWFADRPPELDAGLGHVRPDSRLEPLIDGIPFFKALLEDLRNATGPEAGAHFAGWAFNDIPLDFDDPEDTMFTKVIGTLRNGDGARFLMDKYLVFKPDAPGDPAARLAVLLLTAATDALLLRALMNKLDTAGGDFVALMFTTFIGVITALLPTETVIKEIEDTIDNSEQLAEAVNELRSGIALRARHPARFADNPLDVFNPLPIDPEDFIDGVGSWHQKFQVVRLNPDNLGNQVVVGYLGGIDINRDRLDSPGHHGRAWQPPSEVSSAPPVNPFHDVHARITGPAAADVARTFDRRWAFDVLRQPAGTPQLDLAFTTPDPADTGAVPPQPARHLVQVGRTGYRAGSGGTPLPWSTVGEATIPQAILRAIGQAREYIYIEEQYFTPHDDYVHALLEASVREPKLRLLIVLPTEPDQTFGGIRRAEILARLRADPATGRGWGDRMIVGGLVRRQVLIPAGRVASKGRLSLQRPLGQAGGEAHVALGPRPRLPNDVPFWLWIEGERMLAVENRDNEVIDGVPARNFLVRRAENPTSLWGARPRAHAKGAPVTLAQAKGIYVHTKAIMVDDVFVGIGSANANRRGFFHDGEIHAFAVPERLKGSLENPALNLRTALWAEHLGIPPAMGRALLADPVAAFELFRRSTLNGNRVSPFDALPLKPELGFPDEATKLVQLFVALGLPVVQIAVPYIWNTLADPTSDTDPNPTIGPGLGPV